MNIIQYNYPTIYNKHVINANMLSKQANKQVNKIIFKLKQQR